MFRLASANLFHENVSIDGLIETVDRVGADVVAAHELTHAAAEALTSCYQFSYAHPNGMDGHGIFSRSPLNISVVSLPFRPLRYFDVSLSGRNVTVVAVHLANPIGKRDIPYRRSQVRALLDWIDSHEGALIVVGDFNASPAWPAYRRLANRLDDAAEIVAVRNGKRPANTWAFRASGRHLLRIDHAFARGVDIGGVATVPVPGSDHLALVVDLAG